MKPSGVIYEYHPKHDTKKIIGTAILALSLSILLFLFFPIAVMQLRYALERTEPQSQAMETVTLGISSYFSIVIPKIDAHATITPNVDTTDEPTFARALAQGVAHARGTFFPGQGRTIFLFAHSTDSPLNVARYNAVFYLLDKLAPGDRITLYFLDKKYVYTVQQSVTVPATDTAWLTHNFGRETLILQTCTPPGTTWKRLLVIAIPS